MQQYRLPGVEGRIEPEPALGGKLGLHHHVGDEEAIHEDLAFDVQTEHATYRTAGAVGGDQPVGFDGVDTVLRLHLERHGLAALRHRDDLVLPAQVDVRPRGGAHGQVFLEVVLLQVHHARPVVIRFRHEVEVVDLLLAKEGAPDVPRDALAADRFADAVAIEDFQRALGVADAARADRYGVVFVEQQHRNALQFQVERGGQADRAGADHHHGHFQGLAAADLRRRLVFELRVGVG